MGPGRSEGRPKLRENRSTDRVEGKDRESTWRGGQREESHEEGGRGPSRKERVRARRNPWRATSAPGSLPAHLRGLAAGRGVLTAPAGTLRGLRGWWRPGVPALPPPRAPRHQFQEEMLQLNQNYLQDNGPLFALRQMLSVGTLCFMLLPLFCLCWVQMGSKSCELLFQGLQIRGAFISAWARPGK